MGFFGVLVMLIAIVFVAIVGMKVAPAYIEYFSIKKAVADVRKAFDRRAIIDEISSIQGSDLEITKEGSEIVLGFAYEKRIPLFYNISLLIDFQGSSKRASSKGAD